MKEKRLWALGVCKDGRKPLYELVEKEHYEDGVNGYYEKGFWIWTPGKIDYRYYIKSSFWNRLREIYLDSINHICEQCNAAAYQLHHIHYKNLGLENWDDVEGLCFNCHRETHGIYPSPDHTEREVAWHFNEYGLRDKALEDEVKQTWKEIHEHEHYETLERERNKKIMNKLIKKYVAYENDMNKRY